MREKQEILKDALKAKPAPGSWDCIASLHERLTIEVLIDIRDGINNLSQAIAAHFLDHPEKP